MRTIICNSLQSFWDMADNQFLEGLDVHCVFPVTEALREFILNYKEQYHIRSITFTQLAVSLSSYHVSGLEDRHTALNAFSLE